MNTAAEIKAKVTCWDLLGIPAGTKKIRCPLPDHEDKNPSVEIYKNGTRWRCFRCDKGGSVIDLYMAIHNVSFKDAVSALSDGPLRPLHTPV